MLGSIFTSILLIASALISGATAAPLIEKRANGKVAAYFGQIHLNSDDSLEKYCTDPSVDIVVLAFMNLLFATGGLPETNFGFYGNEIIPGTDLVTNPDWEANIKTCQANGKLVFLSIDGATGTQVLTSDAQAQQLANTVWQLFMEGTGLEADRPFGTALLDGFDLDIENNNPTGWPAFITELRALYATGTKKYFVSAAPQCPMPDASVGTAVYLVDFLFVQFYNNFCGGSEANIVASFTSWNNDIQANSKVNGKIFLGLPGAPAAAGSGYLDGPTLTATAAAVKGMSQYGGIMTWDASYATNNGNFLDVMKAAA